MIIKWQGRNPVVGTCSSCPQTRFSTEGKFGKPSEHEHELRDLFNQHFRTVHMREDASQAAARIECAFDRVRGKLGGQGLAGGLKGGAGVRVPPHGANLRPPMFQ